MFGFLKRNKIDNNAAEFLGVRLHKQIKDAFEIDEESTTRSIDTFFTCGYIVAFIKMGLEYQGVDTTGKQDKYLEAICDGVMPNQLLNSVIRKLEAVSLAQELIEGKKYSKRHELLESIDQYEKGLHLGLLDAMLAVKSDVIMPVNLRQHLIGGEIFIPGMGSEENEDEQDDEDGSCEQYDDANSSLTLDEAISVVIKRINKDMRVSENKSKLAKASIIFGLSFGYYDTDEVLERYFSACKRYKIGRKESEKFYDFYNQTDEHVVFFITNKAFEVRSEILEGDDDAIDELVKTVIDVAMDKDFPRSIGDLK